MIKPVISLKEELGDFLLRKGFLKTEVLLDYWYVLSNENLTVLVDTIRPRIVQIFAHGRLGTFQMLLYNPKGDTEMGHGLWGIVPAAYFGVLRGGYLPAKANLKRFLPFKHTKRPGASPVTTNFPRKVSFDPDKKLLSMEGIVLHEEDGASSVMTSHFEVRLDGNSLRIHVEYPKDAWRTELICQLYPLYRRYINEIDGSTGILNYEECFQALLGNKLTLVDSEGQMPKLTIESEKQAIQVASVRDLEMNGAFLLEVSVVGKVMDDNITFTFEPSPTTLLVNPQLGADEEQKIRIYSDEKPELYVDGVKVNCDLRKTSSDCWDGKIKLKHGRHVLTARTRSGKSVRQVFAFGNPYDSILKVADALLKIQYKDPPLKGLFPTKYWIDTLEPCHLPDGVVCLSYQPRVAYILAAASILTGSRKYIDAAYEMLEAVKEKSHILDDGSILPPPDLYIDGSPYERMYYGSKPGPGRINDCVRPLNHSEYLKAGLFSYKAYKHLGDDEKARKSLEYAARYTGTLIHMQQSNGAIMERYMYYTLEVTLPRYFRVPLFIEVFTLADLMDREGITVIGSERLRKCCKDQIAFLDSQPDSVFHILAGSEAMPNSLSHLASFCTGHLMRLIVMGENEKIRRRAEQSFKLAMMMSHCYIDKPLYYLAEAPAFPPLPPGKMSMFDYQTTHLGLAVKKYLGGDLGDVGVVVAEYTWGDRIGDMILENGAICPWQIDVPGYYYRKMDNSQPDCETASHGLMSYRYVTGEILI